MVTPARVRKEDQTEERQLDSRLALQPADRDENLSWLAATVIMVVATVVAITSRLLSIDPFTEVFDLFIVYLPTAVLVGGVLYGRFRSPSVP